MAKYTTLLRSICENYAGYTEAQGYEDEDKVIEAARTKLFDFGYPIYDEAYRPVIETKIIRHYYMDEIGTETVGLFKHYLKMRMNEIMPYYNKLYESELLKYNPLYDVDLTTDHTRGTEGDSSSSDVTTKTEQNDYARNLAESRTNKNEYTRNLADGRSQTIMADDWTYNNDTPQGGIQGLEDLNYLSSATRQKNSDTQTDNGTYTGNDSREIDERGTQTGTESRTVGASETSKNTYNYTDTESYMEHVKGKTSGASYSKLLNDYRETLLNIDMSVIDDLRDLFMLIW